jgi:hypothetical protein
MYYVFHWYIEGYDFPILALCAGSRGTNSGQGWTGGGGDWCAIDKGTMT